MKRTNEIPDELNYTTSPEANVAIMRAMSDIMFMRKMERLMPLVAQKLVEAGVDFSKVKVADSPETGDAGQRIK